MKNAREKNQMEKNNLNQIIDKALNKRIYLKTTSYKK
jgi:hypothetical protein